MLSTSKGLCLMPDYNYNYFKYIYHIAHPKLKSSAQLKPCSSGYYYRLLHLILANSLIPNESKISSHKCIDLLNSIVEYLVVDIIEFIILNILLQKCI